MLYIRFSGGEPFIRKDLFDITSLFTRKCQPSYIGIPTNGFYTKAILNFSERVASLDTRIEIGISIDDLGEYHDKIRGPQNLFNIAINTFKELKKIKPKVPNLGIGFITTVMKSNKDRVLQLFDYLKDLDPDSIACNIIRDDTKIKEEKEIDQDVCKQFSNLCDDYNTEKVKQNSNLFNKLRQTKTLYAHEIRSKTVETNEYQIPCVAGNKIIVMYSEGEVHPCETLGYEIGNIRDYNYNMRDLLQSDRAKAIREKIIKGHCFCTHECFTTASITFSKKQLMKVFTRTLFKS
jgi:radical SAM protein with 4Fe4S-binding SPASM domain